MPVSATPRLLFDENLAARLVPALSDAYPESAHLTDVGLLGAADLAIWDFAGRNGFVLVSKDEDFQRLSILHGPPPKVIWIRRGNCSTDDIARLLRDNRRDIEAFAEHEEAGFLVLA